MISYGSYAQYVPPAAARVAKARVKMEERCIMAETLEELMQVD